MTHDEILAEIRKTKKQNKLRFEDIADASGVNIYTIHSLFGGHSISLYNFLDILDGLGLEVTVKAATPEVKA